MHLPTIVFVSRAESLRADAVGYLVLYNAMFIAQLEAVFALAYWGVGSERLALALRNNLAAAKLGMAMLFAGLAVLVLATV